MGGAGAGGGNRSGRRRPGRRVAVVLGFLVVAALAPRTGGAQQAEADVFAARGVLAYQAGRFEEALAAFQEALRLVPAHLEALYYAGLTLTALGRLEEAAGMLERARQVAPEDDAVRFQLGVLLFGLRRYEEAAPLLEAVFARDPRRENLGYYVGFLRYRRGDLEGAVRAFEQAVTPDPRLAQLARFYSGLALAGLGLRERAAAEIEQALRLLPASPLTGPAERLRELVVGIRRPERRLRAEVRVGGFYDDNVPASPGLSDDPVVRDLRRREQASAGELGSLRLDFSVVKTPRAEATASYAFFVTYNNELPAFNLLSHQLGLSGALRGTLGALPAQALLQYTYEYVTLGGEAFVQRHTLAPYATLVEDRWNVTAVQVRFQPRDFAGEAALPPEERRSGQNVMAGFTHFVRFPGDRHLLKVGYQFDVDEADGRNFQYRGHRLLAGVQVTLPWRELRVRYDFDLHLRHYRHRHSLFPAAAPGTRRRADTEQTHIVALTIPLPGDLTLVAEYQGTVARSNLDVFTFDRNVFSLSLVWSY